MSMENEEASTIEDIWDTLEGYVGEGDFESAQETIDGARVAGWPVDNMQKYLQVQQEKNA